MPPQCDQCHHSFTSVTTVSPLWCQCHQCHHCVTSATTVSPVAPQCDHCGASVNSVTTRDVEAASVFCHKQVSSERCDTSHEPSDILTILRVPLCVTSSHRWTGVADHTDWLIQSLSCHNLSEYFYSILWSQSFRVLLLDSLAISYQSFASSVSASLIISSIQHHRPPAIMPP